VAGGATQASVYLLIPAGYALAAAVLFRWDKPGIIANEDGKEQ
jgi:hypothetical protein